MVRAAIALVVLVGCRAATREPAGTRAPEAEPVERVQPVVEVKPVEPVAPAPVVAAIEPDPGAPAGPVVTGPEKVRVRFRLAPEIGAGPPVLTIKVENPSAQAVPMTRFDDGACVVRHYLDLRVTRPDGKPQALLACAVKDWPGRDEPLAAGGELEVRVALADLAPTWPRGTYSLEIGWDPGELVRARGEAAAVRASQTSLNISEFTVARPLTTVKLSRGQTVTLPDGVQLKFSGHSHKDVGPGDSSPLIIRGVLTRAGKQRGEEFSLNLYTEDGRVFWLDEVLGFELVDYEYDDWMRVKYYGKRRRP